MVCLEVKAFFFFFFFVSFLLSRLALKYPLYRSSYGVKANK